MKNNLKLCTIIPPNFGYKQQELMSDIALSVGATYFSESTGPKQNFYGLHKYVAQILRAVLHLRGCRAKWGNICSFAGYRRNFCDIGHILQYALKVSRSCIKNEKNLCYQMLGRGLEEALERLVGSLTGLRHMVTPIEICTPKKGVFWICASCTQLIKKFLTKFFIQNYSTRSKLSFELFERFLAPLFFALRFLDMVWRLTLKLYAYVCVHKILGFFKMHDFQFWLKEVSIRLSYLEALGPKAGRFQNQF